MIAGVDEAGRGALAGNVIAAAVILPPGEYPALLTDSKKLTARQREQMYEWITGHALAVAWAACDAATIDRLNIHRATLQAMRDAVRGLTIAPQQALVDGKFLPELPCPGRAIIGGDAQVPCIAAASIIAKVVRDRQMLEADALYPQYGFARHKGYGSAAHREALRIHGACPLHRRSYAPVREVVEKGLFAL
ncbi:MAG: ribonuclease HII [Cardiobacteriaceae bacterium]|nr:ribonuclease HII [Cardiobacteriaceae bacterium]